MRLGCFDALIDAADVHQPRKVGALCVLLDIAQKFDGLRFKARFAGIRIGNDCLDLHRDNETVRVNKPRALNSLSWYWHVNHHGPIGWDYKRKPRERLAGFCGC